MISKHIIPIAISLLTILLLPACQPQEQASLLVVPQHPTEPALPTGTQFPVQTPASPENTLPTATATAAADSTPTSLPRPTKAPAPTIQRDFVRRMCPELGPPLGLFSIAEPFINQDTDPETVYTLYQVEELKQNGSANPCILYLSPGPIGEPQIAGNDLFWKSFDHDTESVTVWQYDPLTESTNDSSPQHLSLLQTMMETSMGKSGLTDFVASYDGELLTWSYTDPRVNEDNQLAYVQTIYAISPGSPSDQRPVLEIWFDVVPETDGRPHIIRLHLISDEENRIYFSDEPIGLGRHWPEPAGQYSSLYSISTLGDAFPELHYDCGQDYWCISDFSEELDLFITIEGYANAIEIRRLSSGELISTLQLPEAYNFVRQALINPDGGIAMMGVDLDGSIFDGPPTDVAIFYSELPYLEDPILVLSEAGLQNLLGWVSSEQILADGNQQDDIQPSGISIPSKLMLIDIATKSGAWLPVAAHGFSALVP